LKTQLTSIIRREIRSTTNGPSSFLNFNRPAHVWLRLVRSGSNFTGFTSVDGSNWDFAFAATISMTGCIYAGIFAESINVNVTTNASFDNVTIIGGTQPLGAALQPVSALNDLSMSVYPNPGNGYMTLSVAGASERNLQLEVMDMMGRIVRNIALPEGEVFTYPLDLTNEATGVYFLRLRSENGVESVQRVVVQE
ncbi:MAG: T9SS type A sorting domain-containing protein, partial [Saprospiraceae bacterium]|nr:T9SS type A sorting domain-containing protein [Saprospiraceae bacterium]